MKPCGYRRARCVWAPCACWVAGRAVYTLLPPVRSSPRTRKIGRDAQSTVYLRRVAAWAVAQARFSTRACVCLCSRKQHRCLPCRSHCSQLRHARRERTQQREGCAHAPTAPQSAIFAYSTYPAEASEANSWRSNMDVVGMKRSATPACNGQQRSSTRQVEFFKNITM